MDSLPLQVTDASNLNWIVHPGMLFNSHRKWWTPGQRPSRHEGLDLCLIQTGSGSPLPLPAGTQVSAPGRGRVAAIIPDFLGHSILLSHGHSADREWVTLLAHITPHPDIQPDQELESGQELGWTNRVNKPAGMLSHLHLSLGYLASCGDYSLTWPDLVQRERISFIDPLPCLPLTCRQWPDEPSWWDLLSSLLSR